MTQPKQKADLLVDDYFSIIPCPDVDEYKNPLKTHKKRAVKGAIRCAEEVLKNHEQDYTDTKYYFWKEVLNHLKEML